MVVDTIMSTRGPSPRPAWGFLLTTGQTKEPASGHNRRCSQAGYDCVLDAEEQRAHRYAKPALMAEKLSKLDIKKSKEEKTNKPKKGESCDDVGWIGVSLLCGSATVESLEQWER